MLVFNVKVDDYKMTLLCSIYSQIDAWKFYLQLLVSFIYSSVVKQEPVAYMYFTYVVTAADIRKGK